VSPTIDANALQRRWIHCDEEDEGERIVFRTAEYDFAPRRAPRDSLSLGPGGRLETGSPGPADRSVVAAGTWTVEGEELTISGSSRLAGRFQVVAVDEERLVLRRSE